jgi:Flp pilus assembly protein TadD
MEETAENLNDCAVSLAGEGNHSEAIACLKKALAMEPSNSVLWFNLSLSYRALGHREDAKNSLIHAAESNPLDADILDTLGVVLHELGEDESADAAYHAALEIEPGNGRIWNNLGVLRFGQENYADACKSFEKAVTLIPDFDDALYNLRDTYDELGRIADRDKCAQILKKRGFVE